MEYDFDDLDRLIALSLKFVAGSLSPEEDAELAAFLENPGYKERFVKMIDREEMEEEWPLWQKAEAWEGPSLEKIRSRLAPLERTSRALSMRRWGLVAAGLVGLALCWTMFRPGRYGKADLRAAVAKYNLLPGGQKATLTLASGRQIVLDSVRKGMVEREAGASIDKVDSGMIAYVETRGSVVAEGVGYNTLATPKGGTYEVQLPDRSVVELNSASSLRYPNRFDGSGAREVELTGEAYFRVARNPGRPFRVKVGGQTVEVLGTEFNVKAYTDEPETRTTLLTGAVRVSDSGKAVLLHPGDQAVDEPSGLRVASGVDTETVVAWKNGMFRWDGATLEEVMRDLARWYNVEVVYKGPAPKQRLIAVVGRNLPAAEVLKAIEISGYHFHITGSDRIEVTP